MRVELKVGILILAVMVSVAYMLTRVTQGALSFADTVRYYAVIDDATGLTSRSSVTVAGIGVGQIAGIRLKGTKAEIRLQLDPTKVTVRADARLELKRIGYLGDKYLTLHPGSEQMRELPPDAVIPLEKQAVDLDEVAGESAELVKNLNRFLGELRQVDDLDELVSSLRRSAENIEDITGNVREGKGAAGRLLTDEKVAEELEDTLTGISDTIDKVRGTSAGLRLSGAALTNAPSARGDFAATFRTASDDRFLLGGTYRFDSLDGIGATREQLDLNIQFAKSLASTALRVGIFESTAGFGLDYWFGESTRAYAEIYRFDSPEPPQLNFGTEVRLSGPFGVSAGGDFVTSDSNRSFFLGVFLESTLLDLGTR